MTGQAEVGGKGIAGGGGCVNKDLVAGRCFSGWSIEFVLGCVLGAGAKCTRSFFMKIISLHPLHLKQPSKYQESPRQRQVFS